MSLNQPVNLKGARGGVHDVEVSGKLYKLGEEVRENLAAAEANSLDYVINLGITLLHAAIGKTITLTDPATGEEEIYRLWQA